LRRMASCDPLTGLLNRAEIEDALGERLQDAPERVALLYCDLDGFKAVNDNHGHDVGDELLVEIAQILEAKTRPGDLVGRLGGDEFAVLVDSSDPADAHGLACRIAVAIAELSSYRRLPVSASVGAATARRGDSTRDLLRRADAAMYDEKRRRRFELGRGR
jgi:diguanylate cyclase